MNRSKLIGATALASVMAAGAAHSEMAINGYFAGTLTDNDGGGLASTFSTNSIYVSYSDSMDNGMGVGLTMSVTAAGIKTDVNFDTGMGTIGFGETQHSAVDGMDSNPGCFSILDCYNVAMSGKNGGTNLYDDGDASSGNSIKYSNSMGGVSFAISRGMESATNEPTMSYAASTSIMGATVAAGVSSMGVGTSVGGMDVGVQFASYDSTTDTDYMRVSVNKGMGPMSLGVDYIETDADGTANDTDQWKLNYVIGF